MNNYVKNTLKTFVVWTKLKVKIHFSKKEIYPKKKEIWWASLGYNIGVEINGKNENFERPVLILKVFNYFGVLAVPISSTIKNDQYCISFKNPNGEENMINMSQIRSISTKCLLRKVGDLGSEDFEKTREILKNL